MLSRSRGNEKRYRDNIRKNALQAYGGKCVRCNFNDWRALQIDHINGGGAKERRDSKIGAYKFYKQITENVDLDKYQILCANCNWIKKHENNENPNVS